jgi:hypothetical protein
MRFFKQFWKLDVPVTRCKGGKIPTQSGLLEATGLNHWTPKEILCKIYFLKVTLSLCLIKYYAMEVWGGGGIAPTFLTSALDGGEWSASCPSHFIPGERAPTNWIGGQVGPRASLDAVK